MPHYKYRAKDGPSKIIEGHIEAETEEEAVDKINQLGYLPVRVVLESAQEAGQAKGHFSPKVKSRDITIFSRQLSSFIKSGMPILHALGIISEQSESAQLKAMVDRIRADVKDGKRLSSALANYPRVFSPLYLAMVRTGEDGGTLQEVFMRISDHRQKQEEIISQVRMALVYPSMMALVAAGTIIFMFTFVMPRLMRIFSTIGEDLPAITKFLITVSNGLRQYWPAFIVVIGLIFFAVRAALKKKTGGMVLSRIALRLPLWGNFTRYVEIARFCRTLELLIRNGIPILRAIEVAVPTLNNLVFQEELSRCSRQLAQGGSFGQGVKKSKLFPSFMCNLIIMGEESGRLEESLSTIADAYERETEEKVKIMTNLLEPVIILGMGLVIGFIVIAMLLPVFQMNILIK